MGNNSSQVGEVPLHLTEREVDIPEDVKKADFDYENLVLEGGGCKTYAYLGALKVLEDVGILQNMKRFAGASGGAMVCSFLSVGYNARELYELYSVDIENVSKDARLGYCSLLPNIFGSYGWHPGKRGEMFVQDAIERKCGDPNYTFGKLYKERGIELCIIVANVSRLTLEYYHPKTTPTFPIAKAVIMSSSIPGFYMPVKYNRGDNIDFHVDGGLLCNFPISVFDGWYLSMEDEDSFLQKLGQDLEPFEGYNKKTLGILVYETGESQMLRKGLHKRYEGHVIKRPATQLARSRGKECDDQLRELQERTAVLDAVTSFWKALQESDLDRDSLISLQEFKLALSKVSHDDLERVFGKNFSVDDAFVAIDTNKNGELTFSEFVRYMDDKGIAFRKTVEGSASPRKIDSFTDYAVAILDTMAMTLTRAQFTREDLPRTIGVHTDYLGTTDFSMEDADREFLVGQAEVAVVAFLKESVQKTGSE